MNSDYWWDEESPAESATAAERRDHWRDYLQRRQGSVGLAFSAREAGSDFGWKTLAQAAGDLQIVRFSSGSVHYRRTARDAQGDGDDGYRVLVPVRGEFKLGQGDQAEIVGPGKVAFIRWDLPLVMRQDEPLESLIMTVPRRLVNGDLADNAPLALDARRPLLPMLVNQINQLHANHRMWNAHDFRVAYRSTLSLLDGLLDRTEALPEQRYAFVAARARETMEGLADDLRLTPDAVAQMCGVSRRTLYTALTKTDGVTPAVLLRDIRLERACERLSYPGAIEIGRIAEAAGYSSVRRFSSAFQRRFELTPQQMRERLLG
ncbi:AraC family transcriptional regulator [Nocardia tengchongensis]|uniref:AraC family transcriptional regulator n=1 Tax=Nocardia tengchongensis TaxID=2055889 RepID=A0ABX8CWY4_9NOCA|nr:AraC family transcriptional regulator [Nocardia tengchongensis]QVI23836.1 AraC family transcriptional regulator [Nocardia tengchongensis]